jgi:hypothetical protein
VKPIAKKHASPGLKPLNSSTQGEDRRAVATRLRGKPSVDTGSGRNADRDIAFNSPTGNRGRRKRQPLSKASEIREDNAQTSEIAATQSGRTQAALTRRIGHRYRILRVSDHRPGQPGDARQPAELLPSGAVAHDDLRKRIARRGVHPGNYDNLARPA